MNQFIENVQIVSTKELLSFLEEAKKRNERIFSYDNSLIYEVGFAKFDRNNNTLVVKRVPIHEVKNDWETFNKIADLILSIQKPQKSLDGDDELHNLFKTHVEFQ